MTVLYESEQSTIILIKNKYNIPFIKKIFKNNQHFFNELVFLTYLKNVSFVPNIYGICKINHDNHILPCLILDYYNTKIEYNNINDLSLLNTILKKMLYFLYENYGVFHNDLHIDNIMVHDSKLKIIDFGDSTISKSFLLNNNHMFDNFNAIILKYDLNISHFLDNRTDIDILFDEKTFYV